MFIEERHQAILDIIKKVGRISISDIQEKFDVSVDSARRDLRILEEKGLLKRTHGGAIPLSQVGSFSPVKMKYNNMSEIQTSFTNYEAIAKKAVQYIKENDAVYITSGSVGYLMLKYLPTDFEFTVVTNSIDNASELRKFENIQTYIIGGKMRPSGRIVDSFAQDFVRSIRFDTSFITGAGISPDFGISNGTGETCFFQKIIAENSRKNIALFPSQKVGFKAFIKDVDISKINILITDWDAAEDELLKFEDAGIEVVIVNKE